MHHRGWTGIGTVGIEVTPVTFTFHTFTSRTRARGGGGVEVGWFDIVLVAG